jgi:hypothetical protein
MDYIICWLRPREGTHRSGMLCLRVSKSIGLMIPVRMFRDTMFRSNSSRYHLCLSCNGATSAFRLLDGANHGGTWRTMHCRLSINFTLLDGAYHGGTWRSVHYRICLNFVLLDGQITEKPGEQCTVVFALIVTKQASECVWCEGGGEIATHTTVAGSVKILAKATAHCSPGSSMIFSCPCFGVKNRL